MPKRKRGQSTFTEEEEESVCTSSRVGAPKLDRRKCRVSLAPKARTCSKPTPGGAGIEAFRPGFNSTDTCEGGKNTREGAVPNLTDCGSV